MDIFLERQTNPLTEHLRIHTRHQTELMNKWTNSWTNIIHHIQMLHIASVRTRLRYTSAHKSLVLSSRRSRASSGNTFKAHQSPSAQ